MSSRRDEALALLGPLEGQIMEAVWSGWLPHSFVVRDALVLAPDLAYTTMMTTVSRLASKGLLVADRGPGGRAVRYRSAGSPSDYLDQVSREGARELRRRFGKRALAAFAAELDELAPAELERLRRLAEP